MIQPPTLPPLDPIPADIDSQLRQLIHITPELVTAEWLRDLVKNSGHLTTPEYLRWRIIALIWLAAEFDIETAWPYLMWFNMGEATVGDHLSEIITDGVEEMQCHVQLASWIANSGQARLHTLFSTYKNIPPAHKLAAILRRLLTSPRDEAVGVWLADFCRETADNPSPLMRPWHLLGAAWLATCFDADEGLAHLRAKSDGQVSLPAEDSDRLTKVAQEIGAEAKLIQWLADCPDPTVKTMLGNFGHPDLAAFASAIFAREPDYEHLLDLTTQAPGDAAAFARNRQLLEQAGLAPKSAKLLDVACGPLAAQTLLLSSAGYNVTGVDLHIPPDYLPLSGIKQHFQKGKYVSAWKKASAPYYQALAQNVADLKLSWKKAKIHLADLTRLDLADGTFEAVLCHGYLQHAPDVAGLLAELSRVLKPGGLLLADLTPYASLAGQLLAFGKISPPWGHVRGHGMQPSASKSFNQWPAAGYWAALEHHFRIEQWLVEPDPAAVAQLSPAIGAEIEGYGLEELTSRQIVIVARKPA
jgi:SAM-dependent methyltransferase